MQNIIKIAIVGAAILTLTACMSEAEKLAMFRSQCAQFGFTPGTTNYAKCVQKQSVTYEQNENMQMQTTALQNIANKK